MKNPHAPATESVIPTPEPAWSPNSVRAVASGLILLQALGGFVGGSHLWAVHQLAFLPLPLRIAWPLLGLGLIWSPAAARLGELLTRALNFVLDRKRWAYVFAPLAGMGLFWLLRCRNHFLGDGWLLGELVHRGLLFHGFDFNAFHLHARLFALFGKGDEAAAFRLFAVVSTVTGGLYLGAAAWSARVFSDDRGERALLYGLLIFAAPLEMFMGYVETYGLLAVFALLFLASLAAYYRGRLAIVWAAITFGGALAIHLDALFLGPLLLAPILWPPKHDRSSVARRVFSLGVPALALFSVGVLAMLLDGYNRRWFETDFVTTRAGQRLLTPLTGEHGVLSLRHWRDVANLLLLLAPVPIGGLVLALIRRTGAFPRPRGFAVFLAGALWITVLLSFVHMKLGIARDWDLFAAPAAVFTFAALLAFGRPAAGRPARRLTGYLVIAAACLSLPWFIVNSSDGRSLARFRAAIGDQPDFARAYGHEEIGKYFRKQNRTQEAFAEYRRCIEIFPSNPRFHAVLGALQYNSGDREAALTTFQRVYEVDSTYALGLEMLSTIYSAKEDWQRSLFFSRKLVGDPREKARSAAVHGVAAERLGLRREALEAYVRSLSKDGNQPDLIERAGALALLEADYALAQTLFGAAMQRRPTDSARAGLAAAIWGPLRDSPSSWTQPETADRMREALALIDQALVRKPGTGDLIRWRDELRAALASAGR